MDAWSTALGTQQGRIQPTGWIAPSGGHVYVLGHDLPGQFAKLIAGDSVSITQTIDFTGLTLVRFRARARAATSLPAGLTWHLDATVGGTSELAIAISRDRELYDLALPVGVFGLFGSSDLVLTLSLRGAGSLPVEVELPGVYLDAFTYDTTPTPIVIVQRDPEPNETSIPLHLPVAFTVTDPTASSGVRASSIQVTIGGVVAMVAGVPANGYTASLSATADGQGINVILTPPAPWLSLVTYAVRVQAQTIAGSPLDVTYSFSTADAIAPVVVSAFALDDSSVRVTFDEAVTGDGSYAISLISGVPAVTPVVVSAFQETSSTVLLTLNTEQTPGATYQVAVTGVADLFGNPIAAGNTAQWTGYACAGVAGRSFDLYGMMLRSDRAADETGDLRAFIGCFQEVTNLLLCKIDRFVEILDPDTASEQYVDRMLTDLGNPFAFDLSIIDKRRLVQLLVAIYRSKGTDPGIINAIRFFIGIEVTITIPWQTGGLLGASTLGGTFILGTGSMATIYSFVIHSPVVLTEEQRKRISAIARYMKRAPTHFTIVEPSPPPSVPSHWSLGVSNLGLNTKLH